MTDTMVRHALPATKAYSNTGDIETVESNREDRDACAAAVRLRLLGGFQLSLDGTPVELQPSVQRLTAFVALTPRGVGRMFAAFQLWPEKSEKRALANLRSTLWRLNQLKVPVIDVSPMKLALAPNVWLDTLNEADDLIDSAHVGGVPAPFQNLLTDLLPDWYDDWLIVERERIRLLRLSVLETRSRQSLAAGNTSMAIQCALAALAIEGARESAHRLVVEAHLAEGNECEARREQLRFERCVNEASF